MTAGTGMTGTGGIVRIATAATGRTGTGGTAKIGIDAIVCGNRYR
ncbi:hypothetical protein [Kribbella sp. NPDC000426]